MIMADRIIMLLAVIFVLAAHPSHTTAQVDQQSLARTILGDDGRAAQEALDEATRALTPEEMGPELRAALIAVLERQGSLYHAAVRASMTGHSDRAEELYGKFWGENYLFLIRTVGALRDPAAVPALVGAIDTGMNAVRAVAAFGEEAAAEVLRVAEGEAWWAAQVWGAWRTLILMIDEPQGPPLSQGTFERVRRLVRGHLTTGLADPEAMGHTPLSRAGILQEAASLALARPPRRR